jgi:hypothetical protein
MLKTSMKTVATTLTALVVLGGLSQITKSELAAADAVPLSLVVAIGGQSQTTMRLFAPAVAPLDIALLLDATGSQSQQLQQVKSIVETAVEAVSGIDTFVAVAASGDVPVFPFGVANDRAYRLVQQSSADGAIVQTALQNLGASEGGGDNSEGQLPAIMHLLTGSDLAAEPVEEAGGPQNVDLRSKARHVLVVSSDAAPHVSTDQWCGTVGVCVGYPGPTTNEVQEALDSRGVSLVVLARGEAGALASLAATTDGQTVNVAPLDPQVLGPLPEDPTSSVPASSVPASPEAPDESGVSTSAPTASTTSTSIGAQTNSVSTTDSLISAILATPAAIRPRIGNCEGVTVEFQPAMARVKLGESAEFTATATAAATIPASRRLCTISLGMGVEETLAVTVATPCPDPLVSTSTSTSSSTLLGVLPSTTAEVTQSVPTISPSSTVAPEGEPSSTTQVPSTLTPSTLPIAETEGATTSIPAPETTKLTPSIPSSTLLAAVSDTLESTTVVPTSVPVTAGPQNESSSSTVVAAETVPSTTLSGVDQSTTTAPQSELSNSSVPSTTEGTVAVPSSVMPSTGLSSSVPPTSEAPSSVPSSSTPPSSEPSDATSTTTLPTVVEPSSTTISVLNSLVSSTTAAEETSSSSSEPASTTTQAVEECAPLNLVASTTTINLVSTSTELVGNTQPIETIGTSPETTSTTSLVPGACDVVVVPPAGLEQTATSSSISPPSLEDVGVSSTTVPIVCSPLTTTSTVPASPSSLPTAGPETPGAAETTIGT